MKAINEMKDLIEKLNLANDAYYNTGNPIMEDSEYDLYYNKLQKLEKETGIIYANSPTQKVGSEIKSDLKEVVHDHLMLSLDKKHSVEEIQKWAGSQACFLSCKCDGLSLSLTYENGKLVKAETRGNGEKGTDVLFHALVFDNIPKFIDKKDKYVIDGEAVILYSDFEKINKSGEYKNPRNLASGSLALLDNSISQKRHLKFYAWRVIEGDNSNSYTERLNNARNLGFEITPGFYCENLLNSAKVKEYLDKIKILGQENSLPIDGVVIAFDDISYGEKLGQTDKFPRHSISYKYEDEIYRTKLKYIDWTVGRTGIITPTAVFDTVEIDGSEVSRASLHNLSIIEELNLTEGCTIWVKKCNCIIPQVEKAEFDGKSPILPPEKCPSCGERTVKSKVNKSVILSCPNPTCPNKMVSQFVHFAQKSAFNIDGLSESTLEKLINAGFIKKFRDIFHLEQYKAQIIKMDGFGKKSYDNLIASIEKSRDIKLENYLIALGIPNVGKTACKAIAKYFKGSFVDFCNACIHKFDFTTLQDFGQVMNDSIYQWFNGNHSLDAQLNLEVNFIIENQNVQNGFCSGKTFVVTGKFERCSRKEIEQIIEKQGGKLASSVSKNTDFLLNNDSESNSSKNIKAKQLGVPIMTEKEFFEKVEN